MVEVQTFLAVKPMFYLVWLADVLEDGISVILLTVCIQYNLVYIGNLLEELLRPWPDFTVHSDFRVFRLKIKFEIVIRKLLPTRVQQCPLQINNQSFHTHFFQFWQLFYIDPLLRVTQFMQGLK